MGRAPCCDKSTVKRGAWSPEEDEILKNYLIHNHGSASNWTALPLKAGLKRCGKSCRLRWLNYLRPDIKHGSFTPEEDDIIFSLYNKLGSRWSAIASKLQGRTDNDVKNHWNTKLKKKLMPTKDYQPYSPCNNPTDPQASISTPLPAKLNPKIEPYNPIFPTLQNRDSVHQVMPPLIDAVNYKQNVSNYTTQDQGSSISDFATGFPYDLLSTDIWNNQNDNHMFFWESC